MRTKVYMYAYTLFAVLAGMLTTWPVLGSSPTFTHGLIVFFSSVLHMATSLNPLRFFGCNMKKKQKSSVKNVV